MVSAVVKCCGPNLYAVSSSPLAPPKAMVQRRIDDALASGHSELACHLCAAYPDMKPDDSYAALVKIAQHDVFAVAPHFWSDPTLQTQSAGRDREDSVLRTLATYSVQGDMRCEIAKGVLKRGLLPELLEETPEDADATPTLRHDLQDTEGPVASLFQKYVEALAAEEEADHSWVTDTIESKYRAASLLFEQDALDPERAAEVEGKLRSRLELLNWTDLPEEGRLLAGPFACSIYKLSISPSEWVLFGAGGDVTLYGAAGFLRLYGRDAVGTVVLDETVNALQQPSGQDTWARSESNFVNDLELKQT